ncbi:hypothetical protein FB451DRAFT_1167534 [Mycena latifolia]|nr:hypothetical protein FB451DRAFT_1167534 [Mycena latifolia]
MSSEPCFLRRSTNLTPKKTTPDPSKESNERTRRSFNTRIGYQKQHARASLCAVRWGAEEPEGDVFGKGQGARAGADPGELAGLFGGAAGLFAPDANVPVNAGTARPGVGRGGAVWTCRSTGWMRATGDDDDDDEWRRRAPSHTASPAFSHPPSPLASCDLILPRLTLIRSRPKEQRYPHRLNTIHVDPHPKSSRTARSRLEWGGPAAPWVHLLLHTVVRVIMHKVGGHPNPMHYEVYAATDIVTPYDMV